MGLDVGYTGAGMLFNKRDSNADLHDEIDAKMPEFLNEYEHRQSEKAALAKLKLSPIPASSIHNGMLHGHSYHGRKVITAIDSLDCSSDRKAIDKSTSSANF